MEIVVTLVFNLLAVLFISTLSGNFNPFLSCWKSYYVKLFCFLYLCSSVTIVIVSSCVNSIGLSLDQFCV